MTAREDSPPEAIAIALLRELVRSESISGNESENVAIWARYAEREGFSPTVDGRNVWLESRVDDGPALLFNSHLDTVRPGPSWTRDPWDGAIDGGRLHGLGANDAKASVAAQLATVVGLRRSGFEGNIVVCASCDEETGGEGMERVAQRLPAYDAAVIGEPNDLHVATGQRGLVKVILDIHGQRAHASRPWQGHNAIVDAARLVKRLSSDELNREGETTRATLQVTIIEGGTQSNVVPDRCSLTIDSRTTPEFDNDAMLAHIEAAAQPFEVELEVRSTRFRPVATPTDSAIVRAALEASGRDETMIFPSVCDLFWVSHVPAIVMGPGRPERSHQADEFVRIDEVKEAVHTYQSLARAWWRQVSETPRSTAGGEERDR